MTFKIGDYVRCIAHSSHDDFYNLVINQTYEVIESTPVGGYLTLRDVEQIGHLPSRFELADQPTIQEKVIRKIKEMASRRVIYG